MLVGNITTLNLVTVLDRGIPNEECVAIEVDETVNLGQYGLMLGISSGFKEAAPLRDNLFWFGDGFVEEGDWIFVYTGTGEPRVTPSKNGGNIYSIHWGRNTTMFANTNIVPMLFQVNAVSVTDIPRDQPQLKKL